MSLGPWETNIFTARPIELAVTAAPGRTGAFRAYAFSTRWAVEPMPIFVSALNVVTTVDIVLSTITAWNVGHGVPNTLSVAPTSSAVSTPIHDAHGAGVGTVATTVHGNRLLD